MDNINLVDNEITVVEHKNSPLHAYRVTDSETNTEKSKYIETDRDGEDGKSVH